jgi:predicted amidohydrolase
VPGAYNTNPGERSPEGREEFLRYHKSAIEIPSPAITRLESISAETGVFLIVGVIEKDGGTLYCSVVFIDPAQGYVGKHRKLAPTALERVIWGQGDASTLTVVDKLFKGAAKASVTASICWWVLLSCFTISFEFSSITGRAICRCVSMFRKL